MFSTIHHRTAFLSFIPHIFIFTYIKSKRVIAPKASNWINIPKLFCFVHNVPPQLFCTCMCLPHAAATSTAQRGTQSQEPPLRTSHPVPLALPVPRRELLAQETRRQSLKPRCAWQNMHNRESSSTRWKH